MTETIHRTAIDHIHNGTQTTYCGLIFSAFDDNYHEDNENFNCPECRMEYNNDRDKRNKRPGKS